MKNEIQQLDRRTHMISTNQNELVFHQDAVEIAILDRWGKVLWHKRNAAPGLPIAWNGFDTFGSKVVGGSYLCKIVYPESHAIYVPFVFAQK